MSKLKQLMRKYSIHPALMLFLTVSLIITLIAVKMFVFADTGKLRLASILLWTGIICICWFLGSESSVHNVNLNDIGKREKLVLFLLVVAMILGCILPMRISPVWNGTVQDHRAQYERMTESILKGQLHMDYEIDPKLLAMENPYRVGKRAALGVKFEWDHAFYNGKYYMYFGVVPVFLLYLPYRLITGTALTGYKGTQVFTAIAIVGMFLLMKLLAKVFFKRMRFSTYASLAAALSVLSLWYSSTTPSLYCTAISAAIMLMVWSLYFFVKAVWDVGGKTNKQIMLAFCGSWCGALVFGCRPPIGLANLLVIPLLCSFLKQHRWNGKLFGKLCFAASPYIIVATGLMWYNYVRFDNPFEFGQAYQLTISDQSQYGNFFENFDLLRTLSGLVENFFMVTSLTQTFPYIQFSGAYINFPILMLSFSTFYPPIREKIKEAQLGFLIAMLFIVPVVITILDVQWAPFLMERYRMDIYFIMAMLCFMSVGFWDMSLKTETQRIKLSRAISVISFLTVLSCCLYWLIPNDYNAVQMNGDILHWAKRLLLGINSIVP